MPNGPGAAWTISVRLHEGSDVLPHETLTATFRGWFAHRRFPLVLAFLAAVLMLPAVGSGWMLDDWVQRAGLAPAKVSAGLRETCAIPPDAPYLENVLFDLFSHTDRLEERMDSGVLPWWTYREIRLRFWRPAAGDSDMAHGLNRPLRGLLLVAEAHIPGLARSGERAAPRATLQSPAVRRALHGGPSLHGPKPDQPRESETVKMRVKTSPEGRAPQRWMSSQTAPCRALSTAA